MTSGLVEIFLVFKFLNTSEGHNNWNTLEVKFICII